METGTFTAHRELDPKHTCTRAHTHTHRNMQAFKHLNRHQGQCKRKGWKRNKTREKTDPCLCWGHFLAECLGWCLPITVHGPWGCLHREHWGCPSNPSAAEEMPPAAWASGLPSHSPSARYLLWPGGGRAETLHETEAQRDGPGC